MITKTYPLQSLTVEEAAKFQFRIVDCITRELSGREMVTRGDLGVVCGKNKPVITQKAEAVIANIFGTEACMLVRGAGSGAIRLGLHAILNSGDMILVHKAPIYDTTQTSLDMMGIYKAEADFHDAGEIHKIMEEKPEIKAVKRVRPVPVLTDDNYAALKVPQIGVQCGADLSCFSSFKLLGPEGVGIIVGKQCYIERLIQENYSGGMQVQGHEALDVLRGMVYAPVALALEAQVSEECVRRLNEGEIPEVRRAFLANAQSKVILVEFRKEIAKRVLKEAEALGAAPYPVGCESKYEMVPLFYRISGTFRKADPALEERMIRINPLRAGSDTVMRIIKESIERGKVCL